VGPYEDLPTLCLPPFEARAFLDGLDAAGGPKHKLLRRARWRELYAGFIASPHFHPWFLARRRETAARLHAYSRALRLALPHEQLLQGLTPPGTAPSAGAGTAGGGAGGAGLRSYSAAEAQRHELACLQLHCKITGAFVREAHLLRGDAPLLAVMRMHLALVEGCLPTALRGGVRDAARLSAPLIVAE